LQNKDLWFTKHLIQDKSVYVTVLLQYVLPEHVDGFSTERHKYSLCLSFKYLNRQHI